MTLGCRGSTRRGVGARPVVAAFVAAASLFVAGCGVPVSSGLPDGDANRVAAALDQAGIAATKEAEPGSDGRYRVLVGREDVARAVATLRDEELPPRATTSVVESLGKGALVPTASADHALYLAGVAGELERTLGTIDGVLAARVHLAAAPPDPLGERAATRPTASVLVKHRGAASPLPEPAIKRLVAAAVVGMTPDDVTLTLVSRNLPPVPPDQRLAHVGPVAVAPGSVPTLRAIIAGCLTLSAALAVALVLVWSRSRRHTGTVRRAVGSAR